MAHLTKKTILIPLLVLAVGAALYRTVRPLLDAMPGNGDPPAVSATLLPVDHDGTSGERAELLRVYDGDTILVLTDGIEEKIRLIGVDTPELGRGGVPAQPFARQATKFTRDLAGSGAVTLELDRLCKNRDVYDRLLRYVYLPDGRTLNAEIIREGYGFAYTRFPFERLDEFVRLENEACKAGAGLWSSEKIPRISWEKAPSHIGGAVLVEGTVVGTHDTGKVCYLNFHQDYRRNLSVVIFARDYGRFPGNPAALYDGRKLEVLGRVTEYRGRPQIVVADPSRIRLSH